MIGRVLFVALATLGLLRPGPVRANFRIGSVEFTPCTLTGSRHISAIAANCAHLPVPENRARPEGRKIDLRLAVFFSHSPKAQSDWVTLIAGGPGQSAIDAFPDDLAAFQYLHKHHNILLVDQRGTGGSHPLRCQQTDWNEPDSDEPAALRQFAETCRKRLEGDADLAQYTTGNAIEDLEAVRRAIGLGPLDVVGVSYGTRVALEYLRRHPEGVRAVILDSVVPPEQALGQDFAGNLDEALTKIFAQCRKDSDCHSRFGDPSATLQDLRKHLALTPQHADIADPVTGVLTPSTLYPSTLAGIVRLYAYSPEFVSLLPLLIDEADHGRPQPMLAQGRFIYSGFADSIALGMQLSVACAEDVPWLHDPAPDPASLMGNAFIRGMQAECEVWPRGVMAADFHTPVSSDKPVLLLEGEWDPVTPPRYAESVARHLPNSHLLVAAGQGHSVMARGCLPKVAMVFVEHPEVKKLDTSCLKTFGPTPAFTEFLGAGP